MTPRKETEPTKEQREAANDLFHRLCAEPKKCSDGACLDIAAAFLARRDEARDAEVVRPWRAMVDAIERGCCRPGDCGCEDKPCLGDTLRALLASPSPASSEPCESHCQHIESCPARSGRPVCICSGRTSVI